MQDDQSQPVYIQQRNKYNQLIRKYVKGKFLGKGGFAKVYQASNAQQHKFAVKIVQKASLDKNKAKQKLQSQIRIHKAIQNVHIVGFEHVFEDTQNYYMILELCCNQTMNELLKRRKRLTILEVQCYLMQLLKGIKYMVQNKIIHRDLKLGNLFLNDKLEIKLGDFGLATKLDYEGQRKRTVCGTPNYIAPQIVDKSNFSGHSYEVDIWSFGVIAYTLLIGKPPFETSQVHTTYKRIKNCQYTFPENLNIPSSAINLISRIFVLDPCKRLTVNEIFEHEFFTSNEIPHVMPLSTLACPPPQSFTKQYKPQQKQISEKGKAFKQKKKNLLQSNLTSQMLKTYEKKQIVKTQKLGFNSLKNDLQNRVRGVTMEKHDGAITSSRHSVEHIKGASYVELQRVATTANVCKRPLKQQLIKKDQPGSVWVLKWVDYASKFGVGYVLNNGDFGAHFNDQSKILTSSQGEKIIYIQRTGNGKQQSIQIFNIQCHPQRLTKKIKLIKYFKSQLQQKIRNIQHQIIYNKTNQYYYVKKWLKAKHATVFRLNTKLVQLVFHDQTQIILSSQAKTVIYKNKKGQRDVYTTAYALDSQNEELRKRMQYARESLSRFLDKKQDQNKRPEQRKEQEKGAFSKSQQNLRLISRLSLQKRKESEYNMIKSSSTIGRLNLVNGNTLVHNYQLRNDRLF